jgi:hypothetical protein
MDDDRGKRDVEERENVGGLWVSGVKFSLIVGGRPQFLGFAQVEINRVLILDHISVYKNAMGAFFVKFPLQEKSDTRDFFYYFRAVRQDLTAMIGKAVERKIKSFSKPSDSPFSKPRHDRECAGGIPLVRGGVVPGRGL